MTKRERKQVIEVLRCGADNAQSERYGRRYRPLKIAPRDLASGRPVAGLAAAAFDAANGSTAYAMDYQTRLLEAAARVEERCRP